MTTRAVLIWAAALGLSGVAAGAFGAHGLRESVPASSLEVWKTGAHYQQIHAAVLVGVAAWLGARPGRLLAAAAAAFIGGVLVFSGSLYAIVLGAPRALGAVTPLGGLALMLGWGLLLTAGARMRPEKRGG